MLCGLPLAFHTFNDTHGNIQMYKKISLKITDSSKLYLYSQLKSDIKLENYLLIENSFKKRKLLTKFRVSDHSLEI